MGTEHALTCIRRPCEAIRYNTKRTGMVVSKAGNASEVGSDHTVQVRGSKYCRQSSIRRQSG